MILCHCRFVSDREIRRAAEAGASTVADVGRACGAGTDCGCCRGSIAEILATASLRRRVAAAPPAPAPCLTAVQAA